VQKLTLTLNGKAARSVTLTIALSFLNLVGAFVTLTALGGTDPWNRAQFVGLFGLLETALGLAYLFAPNVWRLPVAEANTAGRTKVRLAASTLLIPHWLAAAKTLAGVLMVGYAAAAEGLAPDTVAVVPVTIAVAVAFLGCAVAVARVGTARPDLDVFYITVRRPGRDERELPGQSLTGIAMQVLSNLGIFPAVKLLKPGALYRPELAVSPELVGASMVAAVAACIIATLVWRGRVAWKAPAAQEREAEAELAATT
jgi:hypothetical protein